MNGHQVRSWFVDGLTVVILLFVGLSFFLNPTTEQLLDLQFISSLFFGTLLFGCLLSAVLQRLEIVTLGSQLFPNLAKAPMEIPRPWFKTFAGVQFLITFLILFSVGVEKIHFSFFEIFNRDGFSGARRLFVGIFNPNWSVLPAAVLNIIETIFMAFMATIIATPFAFFLCFFASKNLVKSPWAYFFYLCIRATLNLARAIEALVWAIIFSVWVGIGPFAGMLALMIHSIASLTKQYSEIVESVSDGPIEGVESCGANKLQIINYGVLPQVILPFISFTLYRWDINIRMATIIGLVGGGGIGTMLFKYQGQGMWSEVGTIIAVIALVVLLMDLSSAYIREALK